jgi:hypothetical protein
MFHVLVVMGAALGGCGPVSPSGGTDGATSSNTTGDDPGVTTSTSGSITTSTTGPATTTSTSSTSSTSTTLASTGAIGSTGVIDDPEDCEFPQQLKCESYQPPTHCVCDPNAPIVPTDCEFTQQFKCDVWWQDPPWGCTCDLDAPLAPEECPVPQAFNCSDYEPDFVGCTCECDYGPPHPESEKDCTSPYYCEFEPIGCCCIIQLG